MSTVKELAKTIGQQMALAVKFYLAKNIEALSERLAKLENKSTDPTALVAAAVPAAPPRDGRDGRDGEHGRDAFELDFISGVNPEKCYRRGTLALDLGGVLRAYRDTDPVVGGDWKKAGWQCVLNGIAAEREEVLDGGRVIKRLTVYTDGTENKREYRTNATIWRGVWREDAEYAAGDLATVHGSVWHANGPSKGARPGTGSPDWTLMVKAGRDGKDVSAASAQPSKTVNLA